MVSFISLISFQVAIILLLIIDYFNIFSYRESWNWEMGDDFFGKNLEIGMLPGICFMSYIVCLCRDVDTEWIHLSKQTSPALCGMRETKMKMIFFICLIPPPLSKTVVMWMSLLMPRKVWYLISLIVAVLCYQPI